ncbi:putative quinol monooxygenase [Amycolatopsis sp. NPDC088138]|uniref:putative quinol monooxygenase n=1 Tax=Amycolatopsis sp. NPDC088138 TaxID=3363938 RepID=UPI0038111E29
MTVIIAGPVFVEPADRDRVVAGLRVVVEAARQHPGCLDVSISPDPVDPGRVNIFEHWETQEILDAWRAIAPPPTSSAELTEDRVRKHVVARTGHPFE